MQSVCKRERDREISWNWKITWFSKIWFELSWVDFKLHCIDLLCFAQSRRLASVCCYCHFNSNSMHQTKQVDLKDEDWHEMEYEINPVAAWIVKTLKIHVKCCFSHELCNATWCLWYLLCKLVQYLLWHGSCSKVNKFDMQQCNTYGNLNDFSHSAFYKFERQLAALMRCATLAEINRRKLLNFI